MAFQPGAPLEWVRPVHDEDDTVGSHSGAYMALNVRNAQPNMHYYYEAKHASRILRRMNQGFQVVQADDPEEFGAELPDNVSRLLDGVKAFNDVVLMRIPMERYRELSEARQLSAREAEEASTSAYLNEGTHRAEQLGPQRSGQSNMYYRKPGHGREVKDRLE